MKHKPWRAAAETETETETAAETAPDQNHNIPEISNFGDIITDGGSYIGVQVRRNSTCLIICHNVVVFTKSDSTHAGVMLEHINSPHSEHQRYYPQRTPKKPRKWWRFCCLGNARGVMIHSVVDI